MNKPTVEEEWRDAQIFSIDVCRFQGSGFGTVGNEIWKAKGPATTQADWDEWMERGRKKSLENPGVLVSMETEARIRRFYKDGEIVKDNPEWPYLGSVPNGRLW